MIRVAAVSGRPAGPALPARRPAGFSPRGWPPLTRWEGGRGPRPFSVPVPLSGSDRMTSGTRRRTPGPSIAQVRCQRRPPASLTTGMPGVEGDRQRHLWLGHRTKDASYRRQGADAGRRRRLTMINFLMGSEFIAPSCYSEPF